MTTSINLGLLRFIGVSHDHWAPYYVQVDIHSVMGCASLGLTADEWRSLQDVAESKADYDRLYAEWRTKNEACNHAYAIEIPRLTAESAALRQEVARLSAEPRSDEEEQVTYDAQKSAALVAQAREDDERIPAGPWTVWTSNSFRRITGPDRKDGGVLSAVVHRDGQADLSMREEALKALCSIRNRHRDLADQLAAASAEVERLRIESDSQTRAIAELVKDAEGIDWDDVRTFLRVLKLRDDAAEDRDRLSAEVSRLTKELDEERREREKWQQRDEMDHRGVLVDQLIAERDRLTKENERMRAVMDAALRWHREMDWCASRAPGEMFTCETLLVSAIDTATKREGSGE